MQIESIRLEKQTWGVNEGKLVGTVEFISNSGKISLVIAPEHANKIIQLCAEALVASARDVASMMVTEIHTQVVTLPAPDNDEVIF